MLLHIQWYSTHLFHYADNLALVIIFCISVLFVCLLISLFVLNVICCFLGISSPLHILLCLSPYSNLPSFQSQITAACPSHLILDVQIYYNHPILLTGFCSPSKNVVLLVFFHASLLTQLMLFLTLFKCLVVLFTV